MTRVGQTSGGIGAALVPQARPRPRPTARPQPPVESFAVSSAAATRSAPSRAAASRAGPPFAALPLCALPFSLLPLPLRSPRLWPLPLIALALLSGCGGGRPTEDMLRGGIPARTDLHRASQLPPDAVRGVSRRDFGWRVMYHPARAPATAEQQAAAALCRLESRRALRIEHVPRIDPTADPGLRIIDVHCT